MFSIYLFSLRVLNNCLTIIGSFSVEFIAGFLLFCFFSIPGYAKDVLGQNRCRNNGTLKIDLFLDLGFPPLLVAVADSTVEVDDRLLDPFKSF